MQAGHETGRFTFLVAALSPAWTSLLCSQPPAPGLASLMGLCCVAVGGSGGAVEPARPIARGGLCALEIAVILGAKQGFSGQKSQQPQRPESHWTCLGLEGSGVAGA